MIKVTALYNQKMDFIPVNLTYYIEILIAFAIEGGMVDQWSQRSEIGSYDLRCFCVNSFSAVSHIL